MSDQIIQSLGFDASGAIQGINQVINALNGLNNALIRSADALKKFNANKLSNDFSTLSKQIDSTAKAAGKLNKAGKIIDNVTKKTQGATQASRGFLLSWQTIGRIALAQGIVRSLNALQSQFREAIGTAEEFGIALAEAAAISPRGIQNFDSEVNNLNTDLINLSNQFGFDVLDLAEAKYQEFSNQVKGSADSNALFTSSLKLARISSSEVSEAVGALSSVLNSYDLSVQSSDQVSAALFKTIELGRTRLKDIADQLGNVTPLARSAGISFNEVGASLATITRAGVSPTRALTQLRAIINQLQKPTKELQKLFTEVFKVANIQEAIQKFGGLQGVIQAIAAQAQGDSSRIAQFFTNIRARTAFEALSSQSELLAENIKKIGDAANEATSYLDKVLEKFNEQDAVKFRKALEQLKNEFLVLAQNALPIITKGLGLVSGAVHNLSGTLVGIGVASLTAYAAKATLAGKALFTVQVGAASAAASTLLLAGGIGYALGELIGFLDKKSTLAEFNDEFERLDKIKLDNIEKISKDTTEALKSLDELGKKGDEAFNKLQEAANEAREVIRQENDSFVKTTSDILDNLVSARTTYVNAIDKRISEAENRRTKNLDDQASIRQKIDDNEFNRRTRHLDDLTIAFKQTQRAEEALSKARQTPATQKGLEERVKLLEYSEKLAEEAVQTAEKSGNRAQLYKAEKALDAVLKEQLKTKQAQQALDDKATATAASRQAEEKQKLADLKENVKQLKDNLSLFQDGGSLLPQAERDAAIKNAKEAFDKIQQSALSREDLSFAEIMGVADLGVKVNEQLRQLSFDPTKTQQNLKDTVSQAASNVVAQVPVEFIVSKAEQLGLEFTFDPAQPLAGINQIRQAALKASKELEQEQGNINTQLQDEINARSKVESSWNKALSHARETGQTIEKFGIDTTNITRGIDRIEQKFAKIIDPNKNIISDEDLQNAARLIDQLNKVADIPGLTPWGETAVRGTILDQLKALQKAQDETIGQKPQLRRIQAEEESYINLIKLIEDSLEKQGSLNEKIGGISEALNEPINRQGELTGAIQLSTDTVNNNLSQSYVNLVGQIQKAIDKQRELNQAQANGGQSKMFGGPVLYRSIGGFTRGTDTVPAMLTPGEFVVNSNASKKFASQLIAMNAGVNPIYRAEGGTVVNNSVNIGDIKVIGTASPDATARRVLSELRREYRRGTSSKLGR